MSNRIVTLAALGVLACFGGLATRVDAANVLNASWVVTYYVDPLGTAAGTECINFNKTGQSNGVITGVWNSPTFPTWSGQWVQRGQHYAWHGFYTKSGVRVATYDAGDFVNANITAETSVGKFSDGAKGVTTIDTGTATMSQVKSCAGMAVHRQGDPFSAR